MRDVRLTARYKKALHAADMRAANTLELAMVEVMLGMAVRSVRVILA